MARWTLTLEERFAQHVSRDPISGCCLWTGSVDRNGYGRFGVSDDGRWRYRPAHRFAWEMARGPIPDGLWCLHRCDRPLCVSVDHLFLGTHQENMLDMARKGRGTTSKSGLPYGVYYHAKRAHHARPFHASVKRFGKTIHLGSFSTAQEASTAVTEYLKLEAA